MDAEVPPPPFTVASSVAYSKLSAEVFRPCALTVASIVAEELPIDDAATVVTLGAA